MLNDYYEFNIAGHWLPALVNDDFSGLSDAEANEVEEFIYPYIKSLPDLTVAVMFDDGASFARDAVSDLYADCYTVRLYFTNTELVEA
jgi:hypothetical protein